MTMRSSWAELSACGRTRLAGGSHQCHEAFAAEAVVYGGKHVESRLSYSLWRLVSRLQEERGHRSHHRIVEGRRVAGAKAVHGNDRLESCQVSHPETLGKIVQSLEAGIVVAHDELAHAPGGKARSKIAGHDARAQVKHRELEPCRAGQSSIALPREEADDPHIHGRRIALVCGKRQRRPA